MGKRISATRRQSRGELSITAPLIESSAGEWTGLMCVHGGEP